MFHLTRLNVSAKIGIGLALLLALGLAGCGTVRQTVGFVRPDYTKLPEDTLREIAREIETAVAEGNRDAEIADRGGIVLSTPQMRQAIRTRAARSALVDEFRSLGWGIEKHDGLITIARTREYAKARTRQEKNRDAGIIISENDNRWALYEGIRKESGLPPDALSAIQSIFAQERRALMSPGQRFRAEEGLVVIE